MAGKKISELPPVGALTGTELLPAVQSNVTSQVTINELKTFATSSLGTAAIAATTEFATAAQGGKADTAIQPADIVSFTLLSAINLGAR